VSRTDPRRCSMPEWGCGEAVAVVDWVCGMAQTFCFFSRWHECPAPRRGSISREYAGELSMARSRRISRRDAGKSGSVFAANRENESLCTVADRFSTSVPGPTVDVPTNVPVSVGRKTRGPALGIHAPKYEIIDTGPVGERGKAKAIRRLSASPNGIKDYEAAAIDRRAPRCVAEARQRRCASGTSLGCGPTLPRAA